MSIRATIEKKKASFSISRSQPDRVFVSDPIIAEGYGKYLHTDSRRPYVYLSDLWRYPRSPDLGEDELPFPDDVDTELPDWIGGALVESLWAHQHTTFRKDGVAWRVDGKVIIQGKFTLTLFERISNLDAADLYYSMHMEAWVLTDLNIESSGIDSVLDDYDIIASADLVAFLEGRQKWKDLLSEHSKSAIRSGYQLPHIFPTIRTLKSHQEDAVLAQNSFRSTMLADQVGLGKSGEFICGFLTNVQFLKERHPDLDPYPLVVITNNSLKEEIAEEILKWKSDAVVEKMYGKTNVGLSSHAEFIVLNVDILSDRLEDIMEMDPKGMVVDEAHSLKNPDALRSKAAKKLADSIRSNHGEHSYITLASGTPYLNVPAELWSILEILGKDKIFGDYALEQLGYDMMKIRTKSGWRNVKISARKAFEIRWCDGQYDKFKKWYAGGTSNSQELNALLLEHSMIRRRKSDVMHPLPELTEKILKVEMDEESAEKYRYVKQEFLEWMLEKAEELAEEEGIPLGAAKAKIKKKLSLAEAIMKSTALRQVVGIGKISAIADWIHRFMRGDEDITGGDPTRNKLIVFAHHRAVQEALIENPELQKYGLVFIRSGENPQEHKEMFQKDPDTRLMICYSGAREGHTLTAAKDVLLSEIPFVPSWVVQMAGRCWARLSEDFEPHEATVHYAVAAGTEDAKMLQRVRLKKASFNAVIDGEGSEDLDSMNVDASEAEVLLDLMTRGLRDINIAG